MSKHNINYQKMGQKDLIKETYNKLLQLIYIYIYIIETWNIL